MKKFICILLAVLMLLGCTACSGSSDTEGTESTASESSDRLEAIKERGYIEVCTEPYWVPMEFIDSTKTGDEQYVGVDIEVAQYIADKIGVDLKIVPLEFSAVLAGVTEGKYDMAISALAYSPEREETMTLSTGYYFGAVGYGFLVREEDVDKYTTLESVEDAIVVTQSGSVQEALYNMDINGNCAEFKRVSSMNDGYLMVMEGKADVCIVDVASADLFAEANEGVATTSFLFDVPEEMLGNRIAMPKEGSDALCEIVNECVEELLAEDQVNKWYDEYAEYAASLGLE